MDFKPIIIDAFATLQKKEYHNRNVFKARAYGKVIAQLQSMGEKPVRTMDDVDGMEGIGEKIRVKIQEIMSTGELQAAEELKDDVHMQMLDALTSVYGIGPVKAKQLLSEYPVTTMQEFRAVVEDNPDVLHEKQQIGLKHYEDFLLRIPRREMEKHERFLLAKVREVCGEGYNGDIVGSYRRGARDSGDIDMLIGHLPDDPGQDATDRFKRLVMHLQQCGYITDVLASGPKKFMGVCKLPRHARARRLDLLLTPAKEYPFALLYFTGSEKYNIRMRKHALAQGYTMNEHGIKPVKGDIPEAPADLKTEEDVVAFLGLEYIPPSLRS